MAIRIGLEFHGEADHVPGVGRVATRFFSVASVPLVPVGSYILAEAKDAFGEPIAIPTSLHPLSVLRGWVEGALLVGVMAAATSVLFAWFHSWRLAGMDALLVLAPTVAVAVGSRFAFDRALTASPARAAALTAELAAHPDSALYTVEPALG